MDSSSERNVRLDALIPLIQERLADGHSVIFMPRGTSMLPMLHQGIDQVTLSPLPERLQPDDLPLYRRKNGQYVLHRIVQVGATYTCCGDNQFVMEKGVEYSQMIGVVTAFTCHGKMISVQHPLYRLYCLFWRCSRKMRYFIYHSSEKLKKLCEMLLFVLGCI